MTKGYWQKRLQERIGRRGLLAATGATAIGAALLAACGDDDEEPASTTGASTGATGTTGATGATGSTGTGTTGATGATGATNQGTPVTDTLIVGANYNGQETNDYRLHGGVESWILRPHYETLITLDRDSGQYAPRLAKSWEISDDGLEFTFQLQEGVMFHDDWGEMTAEDVVWNYMVHKPASEEADLIRNTVENVEALGPYEVKFTMKFPIRDERDFVFTDKYITAAIVSKKHWEAAGDSNDISGHILAGTGPWKLVEREAGSFLRFEAVQDHWRHTPEFKTLEYRIINENSTRLSALLAEEIQMTFLPPDLEQTARDRGMEKIVGNVNANRVWMDFWGCCVIDAQTGEYRHPEAPLLDHRVRKAMNKAIDRDALNQAFMGGEGVLAYNAHINENREGWDPSWVERWEDEYGYDVDAAKALMEEAGYSSGNPLKINMLVNYQASFPQGADVQETIIAYWKEIFIDVNFEAIDRATERPRAEAYEFDNHIFMYTSQSSAAGGYRVYELNPPSALKADPEYTGNFRGMQLKEMNETYGKTEEGVTDEEYDDLIRQVGNLAYENHVIIPLFWIPTSYVVDPNIVFAWNVDGTKTGLWGDLEYVEVKRG
jgi:ABC-type transport system substrate-binding protein